LFLFFFCFVFFFFFFFFFFCKKALVQVLMGTVVGFQSFASFVKSLMLGQLYNWSKKLYYRQTKSPYFTPFGACDKWVKKNTFALVTDIPFHPFLFSTEAVLPDVHFSQKSSAIIPSMKRSFSPSKLNVTYNLHSP
jgi:hypothetical protein